MAEITRTRRFQFAAGHRVYQHESKCRNIHGHNYVVMVEASASRLDKLGRVIDFGVIKEKLGFWLDSYWDHGMLLFDEDPITRAWLERGMFEGHKFFLLPYNPTAENMAKYLLEVVCPEIFDEMGVTITHVRVWETENCYADASL